MAKPEKIIKITLDENRMLVLVVQVLLGLGFQSAFQPGFERLSPVAQTAGFIVICLLLLMIAILLMIPARHRLVEEGCDSQAFCNFASSVMSFVLLPFAIVVSIELFCVAERVIGSLPALFLSGTVFIVAGILWYALPALMARNRNKSAEPDHSMKTQMPPLPDRINQVLTECRVVIPGTQALLGFQFVAFLYDAFERLSAFQQRLHLAALVAILIAAILLMLPAAYHRIAEGGGNTMRMLRLSHLALLIALFFLSAGIALDFSIVTTKVWTSPEAGLAGAAGCFLMFLTLWYGVPLALRARRHR